MEISPEELGRLLKMREDEGFPVCQDDYDAIELRSRLLMAHEQRDALRAERDAAVAERDELKAKLRDSEVKYQSEVGAIERYSGGRPISEVVKVFEERDALRSYKEQHQHDLLFLQQHCGDKSASKVLRDHEAMCHGEQIKSFPAFYPNDGGWRLGFACHGATATEVLLKDKSSKAGQKTS